MFLRKNNFIKATTDFALRKKTSVIIFVSSLLIPFAWEIKGKLMTISDFSYPLIYSNELYHKYFYAWMDKVYPGVEYSRGNMQIPFQTFLYLFYKLGLSVNVSQHLFFSVVIFLAVFFLFRLMKLVIPKSNDWLLLVLAFLYVFNPYSIIVFWGTISLTVIAYMVTPMFLYYFYRLFLKDNFDFKNFVGLLITCILMNSSGNPVFSVLLIILSSLGLFALSFFTKNSFYPKIKKLSMFFIFYLITNLFWLVGFVRSMSSEAVKVASNNIGYENQPIELIKAVAAKATFTEVLKLKGFWVLYSQYLGQNYYDYANFYAKFDKLFLILPFLLVFVIYKYFRNKSEKDNFIIVYYFLLFLLSIFMICGINTRLGVWFYKLIVMSPLGIGIRNPLDKFGAIFVASYLVLLAWGLANIGKNKIKSYLIYGLLGIYIAISLYPLYSGKIFRRERLTLPSYYTSVPPDYFKVKEILDKDHSNATLYPFPYLEQYYGTVLKWKDVNYMGVDPSYYLFNINTIGGGNQKGINAFSEILAGESNLASNDLSDLSVKYVLYHKDFDWNYHILQLDTFNTDRELAENDFAQFSAGLTKIYEGDNLILYSTNGYKPIIRENSVEQNVHFTKNSTVNYDITFDDVLDKVNLVFNDGYSQDWIIKTSNGKVVPQKNIIYNNYGNSWQLDSKEICKLVDCKKSGDTYSYSLILEYEGQKLFLLAGVISILGILPLIVFRKKLFVTRSKE